MRFIAAQFNALLESDLWLQLAGHANAMATDLHAATAVIDGVELGAPPAVNSLFPLLPPRRDRAAAGLVLLLGLGRRRATRCAG